MAPPPPPSLNLLRALRALTVVRPILPNQTRRNISYHPFKSSTTAIRQHFFHRRLHIPRAIPELHQGSLIYQRRLQDGHPTQPPSQPKPAPRTPILPSPHLLARRFHASARKPSPSAPPAGGLANASSAPTSLERGPISEETTQTNFDSMDMLSSSPPPASAINSTLTNGFNLSNGVKIRDAGVLIINGEAFAWKPWGKIGRNLVNARGAWDGGGEAGWGLLELVWPKPDLLILGLGPRMEPLAEETKRFLNELGIRIEVQDTRNAAAQFNMLATERGVSSVAAALVPIGWKEGVGF